MPPQTLMQLLPLAAPPLLPPMRRQTGRAARAGPGYCAGRAAGIAPVPPGDAPGELYGKAPYAVVGSGARKAALRPGDSAACGPARLRGP